MTVPHSTPLDVVHLASLDGDGAAADLPVRRDGGLALFGPVAGTCPSCAEHARLTTQGAPADLDPRLGGVVAPALSPLLPALAADLLWASPSDVVVAVRSDHATVATHTVRPRMGGCATCAPLPDDSAALAVVVRADCPSEPGTLRGANPRTTTESLRAALVDRRHGPVTSVSVNGVMPLVVASAESGVWAGYGRTADAAQAERVALFEAVERAAGAAPLGRRTVLTASFAELGRERAVDPVRLGLPDFADPRLARYHPDLPVRWVHGWSYTREAVVAVPEQVAYWNAPGTRFVAETSSGCGLGNSFTEAVLFGLFEVAERDAFLLAWYAQTPLDRVRLPDTDPVLPHLADRLDSLGYELLFFDATTDLDIPAVLALARYRGRVPGAPRAFFAAGAHPDPVAALRSAAAELAVDVEAAAGTPDRHDHARLRELFAEPERVMSIEDHVLVNTLPEAEERYGFLLGDTPWIDAAAMVRGPGGRAGDDLRHVLDGYTGRLAWRGLEVIAVDQTDPVVADRLGLHAAKVLVPGTLPMTFGHLRRRTAGLHRLLEVPAELGRLPAPLEPASLSPHPHPFP
ncbi:YcaO-like family protein [Actinokineospora sp.]|uniref:YcaO-like family protein n=1 Tax=Actinokineospora sp. TaxID=1872133 RepID=UPI0040380CEB